MNFIRGLDPKVAMSVGVEKCSRCHSILSIIEKECISENLCRKCLDELYPEPKKTFKWTWNRLTTFGKFIIVVVIPFTITLIICALL
jgi:uncharacterized paraquat-inducible protein A